MKVHVLSRKLIKPCTPTPDNLHDFKISFLDELNGTMNVVAILYYTSEVFDEKFNFLEKSLAEILPQFYPLAGRYIKKDHLIDCSDQGAEYVEAAVDCELLDLISSGVTPDELNDLLPCEILAADEVTDPLLAIQISKFRCGGLAIGVSISHRVADASSLGTFIAAWTNASRGENPEDISPIFNSASHFPGRNFSMPDSGTRERDPNIAARRFLFNKSAISNLKAKVDTEEIGKRQPSRVQVVCALIVKAVTGVDQKKYGKSRHLLISQVVNIRERTVPLLPKYSCGNLGILAIAECAAEENQNMEFQEFINLLGDGISRTITACAKILSPAEDAHSIIDTSFESIDKAFFNDSNVVWFTDWSKFRFYEADFGWGKPIWASVANMSIKNLVILMDNKGSDGIEAWIHLDKEDMVYFEQDEEIKLLTSNVIA